MPYTFCLALIIGLRVGDMNKGRHIKSYTQFIQRSFKLSSGESTITQIEILLSDAITQN